MYSGIRKIVFCIWIHHIRIAGPGAWRPLGFCYTVETSLVAQTVKCLPTMWAIWVQSLGREHLLEKEMAACSSILAWKIPWMEEPGGL